MPGWHRICSLDDLEEGEALSAQVEGEPIGVYRVGERCHAVHDVCTHAFALLSSGFVEGEVVECPLHAARFSVADGRCLSGPADRDLAVYDVKIENGDVFVRAPDDAGYGAASGGKTAPEGGRD